MKKDYDMRKHYNVGEIVKHVDYERTGIVHKVFKHSLVVKHSHSSVRYTDIIMPDFLRTLIVV